MKCVDLAAERARELLDYDPATGVFRWRVRRGARAAAGGQVGTLDKSTGYIRIRVDGALHHAHRLAWLITHGAWPVGQVDHFNLVRSDNRVNNLRDVPHRVNAQNVSAQSTGRSGLRGVYANKGRWSASIAKDGRRHHLGTFDSAEEAHQAYLVAKRRLHEGCTI